MKTSTALERLTTSYIRTILAATQQPEMLSLAGGLPAAEFFPIKLLSELMAEISHLTQSWQYGSSQGDETLRQRLAERYQHKSPEQLMITSGTQQGLDLISRAFIEHGDTVLLEYPSYPGAIQTFQLSGARLLQTPLASDGPDLNALEAMLKNEQPKLFYAIPDFQNPTGYCWSLEKRLAVANLLDRYGVALIEDQPYRELRFDGAPLPTVSSLMEGESFQLGSLSKIACPGLRLGFVAATPTLLTPLLQIKQATDLHSSSLSQQLALGLLQHPGFSDHLGQLCSAYKARRDALSSALNQNLPQLNHTQPEGGMFIWATLPQEVEANTLAERALAHHVAVVPGSAFWLPKQVEYNALRLNFTHLQPAQLTEAVSRLAECM